MSRHRNKKKIIAIVLALLHLSCCIPSGGSGDEGPQSKQQKLSCYFGIHRYGAYERHSRTPSTAVSARCSKEEPKKMSTLDEVHGMEEELFGAFSKTDLALTRGGSYYMKDRSEEIKWNEMYICESHKEELITKWKRGKKHIHRDHEGTKVLCSWPFEKHDKHISCNHIHYVHREQARLYLVATGKHIHLGTPLCYDHYKEMIAAIEEYVEKKKDPECKEGLPTCSDSDKQKCSREEMIGNKFIEFTNLIGLTRMCPRKDYSNYKQGTQRKKVDSILTVQKWVIHLVAPGEEEAVQSAVNARCSRGSTSEAEASIVEVMEVIAHEFLFAPTKRLRDYVLSLVTGSYPYHVISRFIPSLSLSKFYRSELVASSGNLHPPPVTRVLDRYDHEGVLYLVAFINNPHILVGLPWGSRTVTLSTGEVLEIPNTIRLMGHTEIVRQFGQFMRENNLEKHLLSDSTIYRILRALPAEQRHAMTCVDNYKAKAFYSFEDYLAILDRLLELNVIDKETHKKLRYDVLEVQAYLRTDFPLHIKEDSVIADHSYSYALSDPSEPDFRKVVPRDFEHQCPRCNHMARTLRNVPLLIEKAVDNSLPQNKKELGEIQFRIKSHTEVITELKHHEIRSVFTDRVREGIITNLMPGEGLITLDWARRFEPMFHSESQEEYFGKPGFPWHFAHLLIKVGNEYAHHTFIHLIETVAEDSTAVVAILEHILTDAKKMGVDTFYIRSDNAGCYHSSETLGSVQWLAQRTGTTITDWSFSEAQHGKSVCDQQTSVAKGVIRRYVNMGNNVISHEDMYKALTSSHTRGVSVHRVSVKTPFNNPDLTKLPKISDYGHFQFTPTTIRVWKYYNIGSGRIVPNMEGTQVQLDMLQQEGYLAIPSEADIQMYLVKNKIKANYWYNDYKKKDADDKTEREEIEEPENRDDDAVSGQPTGARANPRDILHYCWCGAGFKRYGNLLNHLTYEAHRVLPEQINIFDFSIKAFKGALESIINLSPILPLKDVIEAIFDPSIPVPEEGFALKKSRKGGGRLPKEAREFVVKYFERKTRDSKRPDADEALRELIAVDSIPPDERMTYKQIKTLFNRLNKKSPKSRARRYSPYPIDEDEEYMDEWDEDWDMDYYRQVDPENEFYKHIHSNLNTLFDMSPK